MRLLTFTTLALALSTTAALAASPKTYQVTGPVLELTASKLVVQKGSDKWELARDANTKLPETVKVGSKITATYSMTAVTVEDKSPQSADATSGKSTDKVAAKKSK